jgi:hypothetical protein
VHKSSTCKVGQKLGVSLHLLTCSPSAWPSRLLYRRGRKSRRDLWIILYNCAQPTANAKRQNNVTKMESTCVWYKIGFLKLYVFCLRKFAVTYHETKTTSMPASLLPISFVSNSCHDTVYSSVSTFGWIHRRRNL